MHIHILGICGTFMGSLSMLARALGHRVTGSDEHVYPPMSEQLAEQGIEVMQGYEPDWGQRPDLVVIGNALSRGNPAVEWVLDEGLPYTSGPAWLAQHVLQGKHVLAVAGTHGKTTTTSILAWLLSHAGMKPGYLIGGVTQNLPASAALGDSKFFVVEADEYDTAFFDKRSKFLHYRPRTLVLHNLEYDHADIFPNLDAIKLQFHHLLRTVPSKGLILHPHQDENIGAVLDMGCWSEREHTGVNMAEADCARLAAAHGGFWHARMLNDTGSEIEITRYSQRQAMQKEQVQITWSMDGEHNVANCLAAVAAAHHVGVSLAAAAAALREFKGVKRRQELRGEVRGVRVYDDFAHHPTAIAATVNAMVARLKAPQRLIAVIDPRSNTMRSGIHQQALARCTTGADMVLWHKPAGIGLDLESIAKSAQSAGSTKVPHQVFGEVDAIVEHLSKTCIAGDHVLIMSNGGFGGIHQKLLDALAAA